MPRLAISLRGGVSFATSASLSGDFSADLVSSSLHCTDSSTVAAAVVSVATGIRPVLQHKGDDGAVFAFHASARELSADICWSEARLLATSSGLSIIVDGAWSSMDADDPVGSDCVVLQAPGIAPVNTTRGSSVAVVAVIGSTTI